MNVLDYLGSESQSGGNFDIAGLVAQKAEEYGVPPALALAVVHQESGAQSGRISPKGAIGPMQLMAGTARDLGVDPYNDAQNIDGGVRYLKRLLDEFGDAKLAAAAYHAGPGAVRKAGGIPDTDDGLIKTSAYADSIMARARKLGLDDGTYAMPNEKKSVLDWLGSGEQPAAKLAQPRTNALNAALDEAAKAVGEPQGFLARQATSFAKGSGALVKGIGWLVGSDTIQSLGENAEKYWSDIQAKDPETARQLKEVEDATGFWDVSKTLITSPRALADYVVSSVPAMVPGMAGSAAIGEIAAKITFNTAMKAGAARGVAEEAARLAATKAAEKAAVATGTVANMASEGITQGGMSGAETEKFLLDRGMSKQDAARVARETALKVGAATTVLAGVGAGFETRAALGRLPEGGVAGFAKNVGKEALEEGMQNPAQDYVETKAKQLVDPSQQFDPGKSIAIGVVTGGATGGAMHGAGRAATMLAGEPHAGATPAPKPTDEENAAAFKSSLDEISKAGSVDDAIAAATKAASVPVNVDLGQSVEQMTREQQIRSVVGSESMRTWLSGLDPATRQEVLGTANTALSQGASSALRGQSIEQLYQRLNDGGVFDAHQEALRARPPVQDEGGKAAQPTAAEQFLRNREMVTELTKSPEWTALLSRVDDATRSDLTQTMDSINNPRLPAKYRNTLAGTVIDFARRAGVYTGPRQLPAPSMVADAAGNVGTATGFDMDAEASRRAAQAAEMERQAMGLSDRGVQAAIQRSAQQQPVEQSGQTPQIEMRRAPALPAPDPRIYVDSTGNAGSQAAVAQQSADNQRAAAKAMEQRKADGLADRGVQAAIARNEQGRAWREQTAKAYYKTKIHSPKLINEVLRAETPEAAAELVRTMADAKRGSPKLLDALHQSLSGQSIEEYRSARAAQEIEAAAREAATHPENSLPEPTEAQKEAGNYRKAHVNVQGLDITIENPRGSERTGKRPDGSTWSHTMSDHYGYVKRTTGADGEQVDVYVGPNPESKRVFVVDQLNQEDGSFDEHKILIGYDSREQAVDAYKSNFDPGWKVGPVTEMPMDEFKAWLKGGDTAAPVGDVQPAPRADAGNPVTEKVAAIEPTNSLSRESSWVIKNKATGEVIMETFDRKKVDALDTEKYEAVPIQEHLASLSDKKAEKSAITAGVKTQSQTPEAKAELAQPTPNAENPKKAIPLSVGRTPNAAEAITVKDGIVYIGKYSAQSFETGEDVTVPDGATPAQIRDALIAAGAVGKGQKVFGASEPGEAATAKFFQKGNFPLPEPFKSKTDANMFRVKNKVDGIAVEKDGGWLFDPAPRALTMEEKAAAAADVKELNKALRAAGVKTVVPLSAIPTANHALAKQLGAVFGAKVQFVSNNPAFEGVAYKGVAYLTENLKRPELAIAGHEVFHTLEQSAPEMAEQLLEHVRGYLQENVIADRKMREDLTGGGEVSERYAAGEVLADINGAMWLDPKFWREMRERDVSLFRRVAYLFMEAMTKAVKSLTGTRFDVHALVTDVDAVRGLIAQTWADYNQGRDSAERKGGVQFSRSAPERDLIITHNLSAAKLLHADRMGGLPVPSLAVVKKDHPLTGFGEITLLGSRNMADPKGYAGTKVFGADIYSPRYPSISYEFTPNMRKRFEGIIQDGMKATGTTYLDWSEIERGGARELEHQSPVIWTYLKERGIEPEIVRTEPKELPERLKRFADDKRSAYELEHDPEFIDAAYQEQEDILTKAYGGEEFRKDAQAELEQWKENARNRGVAHMVRSFANQVEQYQRDIRGAGKIDERATKYKMEQQLRDADLTGDFEQYAAELFENIGPNERIFQGYTNSGNRRYIPHTLENVVKILKKELRGGENFSYGVGNVRAMFTPQFKSIKQIQDAKDRLTSKEQFEQVKKEIGDEFSTIENQLRSYHPASDRLGFGDSVAMMMQDSAKMGIPRALKENGFDEVDHDVQVEIRDFLEKLRHLPTEYFEAKILRDVSLAEFSGAVIPDNASDAVRKVLEKNGLAFAEYKKGDDQDRARVVDEFTKQIDDEKGDIRFSRLALGELTADQAAAAERVLGKPKNLKERAQEFRQNIGKNLVQGLFDQFAPIRALDEKAYMLSRMSKGGDSTLEAMMIYGKPFVDGDGFYDVDYSQAKGKAGFATIMAPLQGEQDRFFLWVAAQRAERLKAIGLENLFSEKDIQALKTLADGQMDGGKSRKEAYAKALMGMNEFNDSVLKIAVDSGLIDEDTRKMYKDTPYVPFYRLQEEGVTGFGMKAGLVNQTAWKKLKGGTEKLNEDLLANTLQNWSHLVTAAAKNRAAKATLEAAVRAGIAEEVPNGTLGKGLVSFRDGGKDRTFIVNDPNVMDAVGALEYAGLGPWAKPLTKMKHMLTVGVTVNPAFKIRNLLRDSIQAIGTADLSYNPLENLKAGWLATAEDSETRAKMLASGGMIRFGSMLEGASADRARDMIHKFADGDVMLKDENAVKKFWRNTVHPALEAYQELGDRGEQVNRAALYEQLREKGMSHGEAAFWARDLMDFSSSGKWQAVRFLTQVVPFMNARLQGLYKLGRAGIEDYKRFGAVTGAVALASIALMLAYADDDDWKKREDWDRQNYWWFKVGDTAIRIPKPFELGAVGTIAEMGVEMFANDEMTGKRFLSNLGDIVGNQLSMNPIPQLAKPLLDVYANTDSFTKRPIENMAMQRLRPEDRYNERTSEVARFVGSLGLPDPVMLMMGHYEALSPVKIDALTRGYFSWLGTMATTALDYGIRPMLDRGERPAMQLKDAFLVGNFAENLPTNSSRYVSQMYEQAKEIEQAYASYHLAVKDGDYGKAQAIMEEHREELARYKSIESVKRQESEISARINKIEADTAMPAETKRRMIDMLSRQRDQIARQVARG